MNYLKSRNFNMDESKTNKVRLNQRSSRLKTEEPVGEKEDVWEDIGT